MTKIYLRIFFRSNYLLFTICLILVVLYSYATYAEFGTNGFFTRDYRKVITVLFIPLVVKVFSSLIFHKKGKKKILEVFATLLNRHRIIDIEYPGISDEELLKVIDAYKAFFPSKIEVIPIDAGYLILGKMNLWRKIMGENDDFYIEQTASGFKIYLNTLGGKSPVYKFCEYHFGMR